MVNQVPRKRLRFHWGQRLFWVWLYRLWPGCLQVLQVFKPDTLVRWHRKGFRLYWTWKSRCRMRGRPPIAPEVRELIRTMSRDNIGWGEVLIAPRSAWQNPYVERLIRSIRRECLDHVIVFNELHLKRLLRDYFSYYHTARTHLALDKQCPEPRSVELPGQGTVIAFPHVGGLHHEYRRAA
ncbi:MAG: integrase core domain-containing protein [Thiogranum sp.]